MGWSTHCISNDEPLMIQRGLVYAACFRHQTSYAGGHSGDGRLYCSLLCLNIFADNLECLSFVLLTGHLGAALCRSRGVNDVAIAIIWKVGTLFFRFLSHF